jgi:L-fucose mutarotase/ribose pyranase (RbsD/FucU family)
MNISPDRNPETWEQQLRELLPLLGHRNWIVVADSAYPAQSSEGIKTIATSADHVEVLAKTLRAIAECRHVRAKVYVDAEFRYVTEEDAPGVSALRRELDCLLTNEKASEVGHEQLIAKLDEGSRLYQTLILKTTLAIPYTSVFMQLDCGYWSDAAEKRLRHSLAIEKAPHDSIFYPTQH